MAFVLRIVGVVLSRVVVTLYLGALGLGYVAWRIEEDKVVARASRYAVVIALFVLGLVAFIQCSTRSPRADYHMRGEDRATLLVDNQTGSHLRIYAGGMLVGTVTAGRNCLDLQGVPHGHIALTVKPTGEPRVRSTVRERMWDRSWELELLATNRLKFDLLSLQPAASCT